MNKKIIILDTDNAIYNISSNILDCYIDILTPIYNVSHIKAINSYVIINDLFHSDILYNDKLYIQLNDYNLLQTNTISITSNINIHEYFDYITIDKAKYLGDVFYYLTNKDILTIIDDNIIATFDNINEHNSPSYLLDNFTHFLNPIEKNLKRFNIKIYNQNRNIANKSFIKKIVITICIYYNMPQLTSIT